MPFELLCNTHQNKSLRPERGFPTKQRRYHLFINVICGNADLTVDHLSNISSIRYISPPEQYTQLETSLTRDIPGLCVLYSTSLPVAVCTALKSKSKM